MFDPIRGATIEKPPVSPTPQPSSLLNRASASPAIKSLMNPAPTTEPTRMAPVSPAIAMSRQPSGASIASVLSNAPQPNAPVLMSNKATVPTKSRPSETEIPTKSKKIEAVSAPPSNAPTPPQKPKISREVPPLPSGSGLLSGTPFGLTAAPNGTSTTVPAGTNIWLKFDLKGKENVTINFAHEVEKKYGAAALNPRLAARKERQRQLALAGAALEKELGESAEDMSIDMSEPESNNDTDGPTKDGTDGEPAKKKRKRRTEDYDRNDDFIDDEEVLLEEQALMTKDGFFVYSGPLIQEGERPAVERYVLFNMYCFDTQLIMRSLLVLMEAYDEVAEVVEAAAVEAELQQVKVVLLLRPPVAPKRPAVDPRKQEPTACANRESQRQKRLLWTLRRLPARRMLHRWLFVQCQLLRQQQQPQLRKESCSDTSRVGRFPLILWPVADE